MNVWLLVSGIFIASVLTVMLFWSHFHQRLHQELSPTREPVTALSDSRSLNSQTIRFATARGRTLEG